MVLIFWQWHFDEVTYPQSHATSWSIIQSLLVLVFALAIVAILILLFMVFCYGSKKNYCGFTPRTRKYDQWINAGLENGAFALDDDLEEVVYSIFGEFDNNIQMVDFSELENKPVATTDSSEAVIVEDATSNLYKTEF
ncbi:hypothetical protein L596_021134 [Steinernema carpocapsae]|uniref:Uncharacterized protein n=1 Tax=Steinernema carpocapsae TaxID=34508 RepID=A0A4U5MVU1_STECR|nr:hypothetical protein L596_021134 [Steinernema carpocapsae]